MPTEWIHALLGGILIGISVSLMLFWNGRVTGISGIVSGLIFPVKGETLWRVFFIFGLLFGGLLLNFHNPQFFHNSLNQPAWVSILAGLLVGIGTQLGSGCTSGHGVCGISRLSPRSIFATFVFMIAGIAAVVVFKNMGLLPL